MFSSKYDFRENRLRETLTDVILFWSEMKWSEVTRVRLKFLGTKVPCMLGCSYTEGKKVKWSRYRPGVAQRVSRGIALLFHDRGTRREWVVSSTPRPHFTPGKDPVPNLQEAGWAPGSVWTGGKSRPHRDSMPDRPARSQSLYRLSYRAHLYWGYLIVLWLFYLMCILYCGYYNLCVCVYVYVWVL